MNHIDVMKQALEALEEIALAGMSGCGQESEEGMRDWHARQAWKFIGIAARALTPLREALAAQQAHNSVEIDGIKTEPAQQEPADWRHFPKSNTEAAADAINAVLSERNHPASPAAAARCGWEAAHRLFKSMLSEAAAPQQEPDALHLAAMDLARKQADRIAELERKSEQDDKTIQWQAGKLAEYIDRIEALEAEVARFRTDAMNEKAARQALEQQLAARVPLTDDQIAKACAKVLFVHPDAITTRDIARAIEAAHGITKDPT